MTVSVSKYRAARKYIVDGSIDFNTDTIKLALVSNAYTFTSTVLNWVGSITIRANSTAYSLNDRIRPASANGHWYLCTTAGTSDASPPGTWDTSGSTTSDGTVVWTDQGVNPAACEIVGTGYTQGGVTLANKAITYDADYSYFTADNAVWTDSTITARTAEMYRSGTVNGVENPIIASLLLDNSPADVSSNNSDFTIQWNASGIFRWS